jgi:hypothetical protein
MGAAVSPVIERTRAAYDAIFETARQLAYPEIDAFEQRMGYALDRARLESAARVLACPLKAHPPHWQHGRVIYAAVCAYAHATPQTLTVLDIGSAKGFSALCLRWAVQEARGQAVVHSVDVIDPRARIYRNSVAEVDGPKRLVEVIEPWRRDLFLVDFCQSTGIDWLRAHPARVHVAFIDGKHEGHVVRQEGTLLAQRQEPGDLALFDDCQIPGVSQAVVSLEEFWKFDYLTAGPRQYAVGRRR